MAFRCNVPPPVVHLRGVVKLVAFTFDWIDFCFTDFERLFDKQDVPAAMAGLELPSGVLDLRQITCGVLATLAPGVALQVRPDLNISAANGWTESPYKHS